MKVQSLLEAMPQSELIPEPKKRFVFQFWVVIGGIASIIAIILAVPSFRDMYKSDKDKADDETTWQGDLKPPPIIPTPTYKSTATTSEGLPIYLSVKPPDFTPSKQYLPNVRGIHVVDFNPNKPIYFIIGYKQFSIAPEYLYKGVDLFKTANVECTDTKLIMGLKDDRLYISTEFESLQNEETAGIINFNHWSLFKANVLSYPKENDTMLEVRDKQDKIIFGIKYAINVKISNWYMDESVFSLKQGSIDTTSAVIINGYFIGDTSISILTPERNTIMRNWYCISKSDPNWKIQASVIISKIKSIF